MFSQTWRKYLPVILILIKKSAQEPQSFKMNRTDFERAAGGRKIKLSFALMELNRGRINSLIQNNVLAKDLGMLLTEDENVMRIAKKRCYAFSLTGDFEFTIKDITPIEETPQGEIEIPVAEEPVVSETPPAV